MVKKFSLLIAATSLLACSNNDGGGVINNTNSVQKVSSAPVKQDASSPMVGGWAPVFFTGFDKDQLNQIVDGINEGRVKRAAISYPTKMQTLANNIRDYLQANTGQKIIMKSVELKDTDQVKYNLKQVIVTLYFN
ncbi:MAG: hypothetical protein EKK54_03155 [Neisseriaceae bacterium]|nr:MAG: hypothetical protein EKK54_03155 [Neisseriaceae bacterium]